MKGWTRRELAVRVVLLLAGLCVAHLGVTLFLQSDLGSDPFNVFVQGLFRGIPWPAFAAMTHGRTHLLVSLVILLVLLAVDRSYVGIGTVLCMALGGVVGLGTVICAFLVGPAAQLFFPISQRLCEATLAQFAGVRSQT